MQSLFAAADPAACGGGGNSHNGLKDLASRLDRPSIAGSSTHASASSSGSIRGSVTASPTSFRLAPVGGAGFSIAGAASAGGFNAAKTLKDPHAWQQQQQQAQVRSLRGPYYDEQGRTAGFHQRANAEAGPSRHPGAAAAGALRERLGQQQRQQASPISSSTATAATSSSWSQEFQRSGGQHHSGPPSDRLQSGDARRLGGSTALEQQQPYAVAQPPQALLRVSNSPSPFGTLGNRPLDRSQLYSSFQSHHLPQPQQHPSEASRAAPPLESSTATDWDWDAEFARLEVAQTDSQRNQLSETAARWAGDAWEQAAYAQDTGAMSGDLPLSPVDRATYLEEQQQRQRRSAAESMTSSARASWEAERKTGMGCSPLSIMQQQQQDGGSDQDTAREIVAAPPESDSDVGLLRFAVPSVSLPTFAPDGRLEGKLGGQRASDAAALARAEGAAAAWEATFERPGSLWAQRDRERGQQPAAAAAEATSSDNTCLVDGEATEVDDALDDHDDPFDDDTFASFYGQVHVASSATTAQAGPAAEAARRARDALDFSDTRFDLVRIEDSRIEGYPLFRQARHGQMAFAGDTDETQRTGRYLFQPGNPYVMGRTVEAGDVVAEMDLGQFGLEYLNVLQHEAAVLARPTDSSAWLSLGLKQQENERDDMAAQALLQCVGLDPMCGQAYLALSVSYTNEGRLREAHDVLERWVDVVNGRPPRESATGSMVEQGLGSGLDAATEPITRESRHRQLAAELIDMVQRGAQGKQGDDVVDADVQVALGVLFNASEEYEKSQDCFRTALQVRPDDWMLWNRLGAVLANGNRPEEALGCYQEALRLYPGYIRAIFNIGIAYVKMSKYAQAGRYVVAALQMQHADASEGLAKAKGESSTALGPDGYPVTVDSGYPFRPRQRNALPGGVRGLTSDTLWQSLRTVCVHMNRPQLTSACDARDLKAFDGVFDT